MRVTARRIRDGQALRDAMDAKGMTLTALSQRTKELDPTDCVSCRADRGHLGVHDGKGVSYQLIGFLTAPAAQGMSGTGKTRARRYRASTSPATADLIERALDARPGQLFTREEVPEPGDPAPAGVPGARFPGAG
jgi:hypothetical protein